MNPDLAPALRIDRVSLTVPDLDAAERFYRDALGFQRVGRTERLDGAAAALLGTPDARIASALMRLGEQHVELLAFNPPGRPYPADSTSSDLWFQHCAIVVSDMAAAYARVTAFGITPITQGGPETLPPNTGSVAAFKFRDQFGHPLELLHFPAGTGDPVWHDATDRGVFLGIDHTAIAVGDADRSVAFYQTVLGFRTTARSRNAGIEQILLDAIPDDEVDVLALSPRQEPPHLELLAYRAGTRRPVRSDQQPADTEVTRTIIDVGDLSAIRVRLTYPVGRQAASVGTLDGIPALGLHDPDRHCLILRNG